ncbi:MAG: antitoxin PHD [Leptospiraceae bacterium]|nr:antitoxin PHD [Leptospiraceae bacterium]MCP5511444.1 antitoxin PHD [Leptospiraceae bacterium]
MTIVQIKVLRDNLSKYLRMVKEGEVIIIKERDTIIAELKQPSPETENKTEWEILREQWIREGFLIPAKKTGKIKLPKRPKGLPFMSEEEFQKMLDEMREDRV